MQNVMQCFTKIIQLRHADDKCHSQSRFQMHPYPWKWKSLSHVSLRPLGLYSPWNFPGQNTGMSSLSLLQGIFPTQGSNPGLPHCRKILYQLSHKGSLRILEWVAYPFSSRSSQPRNWNRITYNEGIFLPTELSGKPFWHVRLEQ